MNDHKYLNAYFKVNILVEDYIYRIKIDMNLEKTKSIISIKISSIKKVLLQV